MGQGTCQAGLPPYSRHATPKLALITLRVTLCKGKQAKVKNFFAGRMHTVGCEYEYAGYADGLLPQVRYCWNGQRFITGLSATELSGHFGSSEAGPV